MTGIDRYSGWVDGWMEECEMGWLFVVLGSRSAGMMLMDAL